MGIRFSCPACGRGLNVKSDLAGKRGRCPHCQAKIVIPTEDARPAEVAASVTAAPATAASAADARSNGPSTAEPPARPQAKSVAAASDVAAFASPAPVSPAAETPATTPLPAASPAAASPAAASPAASDPIGEAPQQQWYVMPPGASNQYGPAAGEEFRGWLQQGRVTADSLVWRQDWPEWKPAGGVFPQLHSDTAGDAPSAPTTAMPASGVPLPNAAVGAYPMAVGLPPVAPMAFPAGAAAAFPAGAPAASFIPPGFVPPGSEVPGFLITPAQPGASAAKRSARPYRARSSTGPMVAICVLLALMIPLTYLVIRVLSKQLASAPPPAASSKQAEE